jgi:hypothetical protein
MVLSYTINYVKWLQSLAALEVCLRSILSVPYIPSIVVLVGHGRQGTAGGVRGWQDRGHGLSRYHRTGRTLT